MEVESPQNRKQFARFSLLALFRTLAAQEFSLRPFTSLLGLDLVEIELGRRVVRISDYDVVVKVKNDKIWLFSAM